MNWCPGMNVPGQIIESENMYSNKRNRQGKKFFLAYFAVIAILFLWNLFHCTGISWESRETYLQSVTDETSIKPEDGDILSAIEIKDGNTVIVKTQSGEEFKPGKKSRLRGIELLGYENRNSLRLTDETISAEVYSSGDHEKLLSGSYLLCNQTLYPTDETNMYIAFSDRAAAEKGQGELEIRIRTQGLTRNGIFFTGRGLESNEGSVTDKMPALLYYEKKIWNPLMSILYFIVEALLGIGCLILFNTKKVPLTNRGEAVEKYRERQESTGKSGNSIRLSSGKKNIRRMICPICLLLVLLLYLGMTYVQAIKENVGASSYDILVPSPRNKEEVKLSSGQSLRQTFVSGEDHLSGIGIMIGKENEDDPDSSSGKTELRWKILDEKGEAVLIAADIDPEAAFHPQQGLDEPVDVVVIGLAHGLRPVDKGLHRGHLPVRTLHGDADRPGRPGLMRLVEALQGHKIRVQLRFVFYVECDAQIFHFGSLLARIDFKALIRQNAALRRCSSIIAWARGAVIPFLNLIF